MLQAWRKRSHIHPSYFSSRPHPTSSPQPAQPNCQLSGPLTSFFQRELREKQNPSVCAHLPFLHLMEGWGLGEADNKEIALESRTSGFYSDPITDLGSILKAFGCLNRLKGAIYFRLNNHPKCVLPFGNNWR